MAVQVDKHEAGDHRAVSGSVTSTLIDLVRDRKGDPGIAQVLALADDQRTFASLADAEAWSTVSELVALFNAAALVTGDGAIALEVGRNLLDPLDPTDWIRKLVALGSPESVLKHVGPLVEHVEVTSEAVAVAVAPDRARIEITPKATATRHAHLCELTRGMLQEVPTLFGLEPATVSEPECSARGGLRCLYQLRWSGPGADPSPDEEPDGSTPGETAGSRELLSPTLQERRSRTGFSFGPGRRRSDRRVGPVAAVEQLQAELDRMDVLVEGALATALELSGDDLGSLLSQIASRADAVVSTLTYLLMVRVRPDAPVQLHYRGLVPEEAQTLAAHLWDLEREEIEATGAGEGSRLVVDIASTRRKYGRLVEFLPPDDASPPFEGRVLHLFAEYAATALDVFDVLAEVKRSDATARSLLSLSEHLSRVTTVPDMVDLVLDAVPGVTGCERCAVYLWDREPGQLRDPARAGIGDAGGAGGSDGDDAIVTGNGTASGPFASADCASSLPEGPAWSVVAPSTMGPDAGRGDSNRFIDMDAALADELLEHRATLTLHANEPHPTLRALFKWTASDRVVVVPMVAVGELLGVLVVGFSGADPEETTAEADLVERLNALADQAATALQNVNLLERISHLAWHDALTGLPNRRLFEDRVNQELVRSRRVGEPVCMFFVDLDHFKSVNDTLGHAAGDELIRQVTKRLIETFRRQDTVARVGGDEFAVLLPGMADQVAIEQLAGRALMVLSLPYVICGESVASSASIGIAIAPAHGDSYDELLSRADEAMYRAKARGRNGFETYAGPRAAMVPGEQDDRSLVADLSHALERHELFVVYQPYIDLRTSKVSGVEALVRWRHPSFGVLEPGAFIALAERSDVIVAIDAWVLDEACHQIRRWRDQGLRPLRLSVNLASRDLASPQLVETVERCLSESGIEPAALELEITERVVVDEESPARNSIDRLRRLGVRFMIDDFGKGNSSLNRIGSFPVSTLKIDHSFVQVLDPDGDSDTLVSAIITMADRLGLECVAEGVETSLQGRILLQRGCTTAQGYYFSPPLAADEIAELLAPTASATVPSVLDDVQH
ncbi:MAG: EAL domain-containing protein [Acidimicrobiales bacterium]